jgi:hypothetical protein
MLIKPQDPNGRSLWQVGWWLPGACGLCMKAHRRCQQSEASFGSAIGVRWLDGGRGNNNAVPRCWRGATSRRTAASPPTSSRAGVPRPVLRHPGLAGDRSHCSSRASRQVVRRITTTTDPGSTRRYQNRKKIRVKKKTEARKTHTRSGVSALPN